MPPCLPLSMASFLYYGDGDQQPVRAGCKMTEKGERFPAANNDGIGQRGAHSTVPRIGGAGANDGPNWTPLPRARSSSACPNGNAVRSRRLLVSRRQECSAGAAPTVFAAVRLQALLDHCSVNDPVILVMPWASSGCSGAGLGYSEQARAAHGGSDVEITHAPTFPSCDAMPSFRPYQKGASVDAGRTIAGKGPLHPRR